MLRSFKIPLLALLFWGTLALQASPQVQNLTAVQRTDSSKKVDIYYKLVHDKPVTISIYASQDNGATWNLPITQISGDFGPGIDPGNGKHIIWNAMAEHPNIIFDSVKFKVVADDGVVDLTTGLIAYYPFNGNAYDMSGNGNNGSVVGATLSEDRFGNPDSAYYFDGNDYINIGQLPQLQGAQGITVSCWIYRTSSNRTEGFVGKWYTSPQTNNVFLLYNGEGDYKNKGAFTVQYANAYNATTGMQGTSTMPQHQWIHLVGTWNGADGVSKIYKNGVLDNSSVKIESMNHTIYYNTSYPAMIGNWGYLWGSNYYMIGYIDDVRIYNRALTDAEVSHLYDN
ncbi:MAG: LamG domain-containing protein [Candidatus Cloacimonadaceae bacterium]|jgi:hypothetical protein